MLKSVRACLRAYNSINPRQKQRLIKAMAKAHRTQFADFRILCFFNSYSHVPKPGEYILPITGGEEHFLEVVKVWKQRGVRLEIVTTQGGYKLCQPRSLGAECTLLPFEGNRLGVIGAYILRSLEGAIFALKYRGKICTYSATDILPDIVPAVGIKLLQGGRSRMVCYLFHLIPHFSSRVGPKLRNVISYLSQRISLSLIRRYSDAVLVDNEGLKRDLVLLGVREKSITVIPLGIDKERIDSARPVPGLTYDACYVGRLHITKGIIDLIEIWRHVVREKKSASLAIVGGGATEKTMTELRNKLSSYHLEENVNFLGWLPHDDVYPLLKSSRVFVFPSHEEGWGIALGEAMAAGLPAVVYDLPAFRERDFAGAVTMVKLGDYESFARAILDLLRDVTSCQRKSKEAIAVATSYDWERTATQELDKLIEVTEG